ncbi:MAG: hypothetical protein R3195_12620 [Gemmatimonadota bacterium]|nr:hypothetical protein [Gemmatimonadota bacterium]
MTKPDSLLRLIHGRRLWQVLAVYLAGGWLVLQIVDTLAGALDLPEWAPRMALFLLIVGLPIVVATAFVQGGVRSQGDVDQDEPGSRGPAGVEGHAEQGQVRRWLTWRNAVAAGVVAFALLGVGTLVAMSLRALSSSSEMPLGSPTASAGVDGPAPAGNAPPAIAVLPFANTSADPDNEYFSDGLAEALIDALNRIPGLEASPRTSTWQFKGVNLPAQTIADSIGVSAVLAGSVRRAGNDVRISVELVSGDDGRSLWSGRYDATLDDLFATQDRISSEIAGALQVRFVVDDELPEARTASSRAYDHYLLGRFNMAQRTIETLTAAIDNFEDALEADENFALAWAGLGQAWMLRSGLGYAGSASEAVARTRLASDRAIELAPNLADGHAVRGLLHTFLWQPDEAREAYTRALELDPDHTRAQQWSSIFLGNWGQDEEALDMVARASSTEPFARGVAIAASVATSQTGALDDALAYGLRVSELGLPVYGRWLSLRALLRQGRLDEARVHWDAFTGIDFLPLHERQLLADTADELFAELRRHQETGEPGSLPDGLRDIGGGGPASLLYFALGQPDLAYDTMEQALDRDSEAVFSMLFDPGLFGHDDDARFVQLRERVAETYR